VKFSHKKAQKAQKIRNGMDPDVSPIPSFLKFLLSSFPLFFAPLALFCG